MFRRANASVLRLLLFAAALTVLGSAQSWAGCIGCPTATTTPPGQPNETVAIVFESNSFTQVFQNNPPEGIAPDQPSYSEMASAVSANLSNTNTYTGNLAKILRAELKAIAIVEKGGTPPDSLTSVFWGTWDQVVAQAQNDSLTPEEELFQFAFTTYGALYSQLTIGAQIDAYFASHPVAPPFAEEEPSGLPGDIALAYAAVLKKPPPQRPVFQQRWTFWASALGGYGRTSGDPASGTGTLQSRTFGSTIGAEYQFSPNTKAGIAFSGTGSTWGDAAGGSGSSNAVNVSLYGTVHEGRAYVAGWLNAADNWINTTRLSGGDQIVGKFSAQNYGGRLEGGYRYQTFESIGITPYAALQLQDIHLPAYSETDLAGGGLGFNYGAMNGTDTRSELGARFDTSRIVEGGKLVWSARAAWAHDWLSDFGVGSIFQAAPTTSFVVNGASALPKNSALLGLDGDLVLISHWSVGAKFESQLAGDFQTYAGLGTLRYTW
jgi:Autotransporter beta-domain